MNGLIHEHPLAELLRQISAEQISGVVRLARERVKAVVYCDDGEIVFASSNLRLQRLTECLARWRSIPEEKLREATARNFSSDAELGRWLVSAGVVTAGGLREMQIRQAAEALRPALLWTDGEWSFDPRARTAEDTRLAIDARTLFMEAARRLPGEFVETRLADDSEIISPAGEVALDAELLPQEAFVLSRVYAPLSVGELAALSGMGGREARQVIYTLALGSLIDRRTWPPVLDERTVNQAKLVRERELKHSAAKAAAVNKQPARETIAPPAPDEEEAARPADASAMPQQDAAPDLDALFARAGAATHYEVLGVGASAPAGQIKAAYYALAKTYHPDRFHKEVGAAERSRIESAFARIAQAYETLKESSTRAAYDLQLNAKRETNAPKNHAAQVRDENAKNQNPAPAVTKPDSASSGARSAAGDSSNLHRAAESYRQGVAAMDARDALSAVARLGEAARLAPQDARYRAFFGQALAQDARTRRQAEAELLAAVALDARNASYRVMLAALYRDLGLRRRAEGELQRALAVEPQNAPARRLLAELQKAS